MIAEQRQKTREHRTRPHEETALERLEKALEIGLLDTFPASDAVAATQPGPKA